MSTPIRILCVDDHTMMQKGLTAVIAPEPDFEIVAYASSGIEAVQQFLTHRPDVTLMDLQLPGQSGFDAIREIRAAAPGAQIIVLTMYRGEADVRRATQLGAAAYLLKDASAEELLSTIRTVSRGGFTPPPTAISRSRTGAPPLTAREMDVMQLLAKGHRNKEISAVLKISEDTVQTHVKSIFVKLGVHDRTDALATAVRLGIVHLDN